MKNIMRFFKIELIGLCSISMLLSVLCAAEVPAQTYSPDKILEYSLMSLKESAEEVGRSNQVLRQENMNLEQQIRNIKSELERIDAKKEKLLPGSVAADGVVGIDENKFNSVKAARIHDQLSQLNAEEARLQERLADKNEQWKELERQIKQTEQEIAEMKARIGMAESGTKGQEYEQWAILKDSEAKSEENLKLAEERLSDLRRKYSGPIKDVEQLKREQLILQKRLKRLQVELENGIQEEQSLRLDLSRAENGSVEEVQDLEGQISRLQQKKQQLMDVLVQVKTKLEKNELDFRAAKDNVEQLQQNLAVINNENELLYKEFSTLQEQLNRK